VIGGNAHRICHGFFLNQTCTTEGISMRSSFRAMLTGLLQAPPAVPQLRMADQFPDISITNQFGRTDRFRDRYLRDGRSLIFSPMYTTCRGPCPVTSTALKQLRQELAPIFGKRISILSFTVDPGVDTPEKLLTYAEGYGAELEDARLPDWHFLTGQADQLDLLRRALGFFDLNPRIDRDPTRHDATLLFGNPITDRWATLPAELRLPLLMETIRRVAGTTFEQRYGIPG